MPVIHDHSNRRGLLVGINSYPNFGSSCNLDGCINDVSAMSQLLCDNFGFSPQGLTVLQDDQATRQGILDGFDSLIRRAEKDDIIVIQFSGHGSQMKAPKGIKPNGCYQTIVPQDSGRNDKKNLDIVDDLIYIKMLDLTEITPFVTFIFDSCHSGTIVRDVFANKVRSVEADPRSIEDSAGSALTADQLERLKATWAPNSRPLNQRYVLLASCRDEEGAFEHTAGSTKYGAFTYFLCRELGGAEPGASFRDIFERAGDAVTAQYPRQHPQLEGVWDRALFGRDIYAPKKYLFVSDRRDGAVTLNAGAAQGLTAGSIYGIYPPGARSPEGQPKIGSVEINQVRAVTSDAALSGESDGIRIVPGCRAFEEEHFYGEMRTVVSIQAPDEFESARQEIICRIEASDLLRLAGEREDSEVRIYLIAPRTRARSEDPAPQIPKIEQPTWAAVGADGELLVGTCGIQEASRLIANLETRSSYRNALELRNANPDSPLAGKVTLILKRWSAEAGWRDALPDANGQRPAFAARDRIAFEITNNHTDAVYFYVLDFGLSGAISQLYPPYGANEQLIPGNPICIGDRRGEEIELYLPDSFPFVRTDGLPLATEGAETFKAFVTTRETDFSSLFQEGFRGADRDYRSPLLRLLSLGLSGRGRRDARPLRVPPDEEWTTVQRSFTLRVK